MKALVCTAYAPPSQLAVGTLPTPEPGAGEVLIAVEAAGLGYVDVLMSADKHQVSHPLPFAPGMEVVGHVVAVDPDAGGFAKGDRVAAILTDGGFAELARARISETFLLPEDCETILTAGALMSALTADLSLTERAQVQPDETVLIGGAAGGVGLCAVQLAAAASAHVTAAASTPERCALARESGAHDSMTYDKLAGYADERGKPFDVVIDPVGGRFGEIAANLVGWGGRFVSVGFAGGAPPVFKANRLLIKNRAAMGMVLGYYRHRRQDLLSASAQRVFAAIASGALAPPITVLERLEDVPGCLARIAARDFAGKAVVRVR